MFPSSAPASWDDIMYMLRRIEACLDASEQSWTAQQAYPRSEPEFDPILGRPLTSWDLPRPRIAPEMCSNHSDWNPSIPRAFDSPPQQLAYSESYGGGGGYSNNYNGYYNNELQAWPYNTYEPYHYNHVSQPVQYEPPPPAQFYYVAKPTPQQQHYYPPLPSYTHVPDVDATLETNVIDSKTRVDARTDKIVAAPPLEAIGEEGSTPMADPKLEVSDADAGYEQQLSELQTEPNVGGDELNPSMKEESLAPIFIHARLMETSEPNAILIGHQLHYEIPKVLFKYGEMKTIAGSPKGLELAMIPVAAEPDDSSSNGKEETSPAVLLCKGGMFGYWWEEVFLEVSRRLVFFGIYALEEVYKDLLNFHLEDKVIFKGGGVDTLFMLFKLIYI